MLLRLTIDFQGLQFMHSHHVAHRYFKNFFLFSSLFVLTWYSSDCMYLNIMMDGTMYPEGWHPVRLGKSMSGVETARSYTRTERPPKYYFIDFGISRKYDPWHGPPREDPIFGGDKTAPEFRVSDEPCDPFPTDIYYLGNMIRWGFLRVRALLDEAITLALNLSFHAETIWM